MLTVGHGTLDRPALEQVLHDAGVEVVVDVRRYPGSRRNPDVHREALERWLPAAGIEYRWDERLGGRRHLPGGDAAIDTWWTVAAFRAYAAYTRTEEFAAGFKDLLDIVRRNAEVIRCSETLWWRCHRRLIADVAAQGHQLPVTHLLPSGLREPHRVAAGARLSNNRCIVWDGQTS